MLLPSLVGCAFLLGFVLGKYSPRRWGVKREPLQHKTFSSGEWTYTLLFREPSKEDALRYQREVARAYNAAKSRGMIH